MSAMPGPFELRPAEIDDIPTIVWVRDDAFADTGPVWAQCFPRTELMRQFAIAGLQSDFDDPSWRCIACVDTSNDPPNIAGFAIWYVPVQRPDGSIYVGGSTPEEVEQIPWPSDCDGKLNTEIFGSFAKNRRAIMGDRPHYYCELLATRPEYRGMGVGRRLVEWGLGKADEEGLEAYIEALDQVVPLYEKFGWKVVSTYTNDQIRHTETFMLRPAKHAS